ncbi:TrkA C-terminal domain-containing protein [Clostridium sp. E02]|uniref:TrkA C-terminal domain-containing protein n=1 Tax=Clostridium sp. E02 TaxID=2487134 RepID=UPI000F52B9D5|nr:TrkA C-terminal domain-containing protein [Clostridium sp. E02]
MENDVVIPIYARIAMNIASRIANGDLPENSKIYGRSVMASEYGVSPETIRKSMKLLSDMEIVTIKQNSGTIVLSKEKAKIYIDRFGSENNPRFIKKRLSELIKKQEEVNHQIIKLANSITQDDCNYLESTPFENYQTEIIDGSPLIGCTLAELNFWQETRATVIAIRRAAHIILSPGPYMVLKKDDVIIYVGDISSVSAVNAFITGTIDS